MAIFAVYLTGLVLTTTFFYYGGVRGKAVRPELWSVIFGLVWPISLPLVIVFVIRAFKRD